MSELNFAPVNPNFFTGEGTLAMLEDSTSSVTGLVEFSAGCRNNWHTHPIEQILVVTAGRGLYQEEGKPARLLLPSDVVGTGAGVNHWHGATPSTSMTHIAITLKDAAGQAVEWGEPVSDEVFEAAVAKAESAWRTNADPQQTAGRNALGEFAPAFAQFNDDVLFGQVWSRTDVLPARDRSLVTVVSLLAQGITDSSLEYHLRTAQENGITAVEIAEIITHAAFYVGWPKAWAAFNLAKQVWG